MSVLQAIVLGLVQGITEFLPISSTAHLRIAPALLGSTLVPATSSSRVTMNRLSDHGTCYLRDGTRVLGEREIAVRAGEVTTVAW